MGLRGARTSALMAEIVPANHIVCHTLVLLVSVQEDALKRACTASPTRSVSVPFGPSISIVASAALAAAVSFAAAASFAASPVGCRAPNVEADAAEVDGASAEALATPEDPAAAATAFRDALAASAIARLDGARLDEAPR